MTLLLQQLSCREAKGPHTYVFITPTMAKAPQSLSSGKPSSLTINQSQRSHAGQRDLLDNLKYHNNNTFHSCPWQLSVENFSKICQVRYFSGQFLTSGTNQFGPSEIESFSSERSRAKDFPPSAAMAELRRLQIRKDMHKQSMSLDQLFQALYQTWNKHNCPKMLDSWEIG